MQTDGLVSDAQHISTMLIMAKPTRAETTQTKKQTQKNPSQGKQDARRRSPVHNAHAPLPTSAVRRDDTRNSQPPGGRSRPAAEPRSSPGRRRSAVLRASIAHGMFVRTLPSLGAHPCASGTHPRLSPHPSPLCFCLPRSPCAAGRGRRVGRGFVAVPGARRRSLSSPRPAAALARERSARNCTPRRCSSTLAARLSATTDSWIHESD